MSPPTSFPIARALCLAWALASSAHAQADGPALGDSRVRQSDVVGGAMSLQDVRRAGMVVFSTPFNRLDGYGDGPVDLTDTLSPGGRPTLQGNGTFLRVNGLDAQSCLECHSSASNRTIPFRFAVGGHGASSANVLAGPREIDVDDEAGNGFAAFNGRYINPPFLFGAGGIELLGLEMTEDLQALRARASLSPGLDVSLVTHGISYGSLRYDAQTQTFDTSRVEGVDEDLIVRPFGRKGEFATVRAFGVAAMDFHFGMQPVERVGAGIDDDGDGITDEISVGELSALHVFGTQLERPVIEEWTTEARRGLRAFEAIGCASCHVPRLRTRGRELRYRFPELEEDPSSNVYLLVDLASSTAGFDAAGSTGLDVPLFSDLKRHDMGPELAESTGSALDSWFITPRLWGVADSAPYLHDGRATTLTDAILAHGGEGQAARDGFVALDRVDQVAILTFLKRLRTPADPARDLVQ